MDLDRPSGEGQLTRTERQIEERRKGNGGVQVRDDAGRPCAGLPVWVEQESHEFLFGCVAPDLEALAESDRSRCRARLAEAFNRLEPADRPSASDALRIDVAAGVHLGALRLQLDRLTAPCRPLDVYVRGETVGMADRSERDAVRRLAELYTLCFAHRAVRGVFWNGVWDGEKGVEIGLLRRDFSPRPAFRLLQKLIDVVWHTRAAGVTDADGLFRFRGFFGGYRVGVQAGENVEVATFFLRRESGKDMTFRIIVPTEQADGRDTSRIAPLN